MFFCLVVTRVWTAEAVYGETNRTEGKAARCMMTKAQFHNISDRYDGKAELTGESSSLSANAPPRRPRTEAVVLAVTQTKGDWTSVRHLGFSCDTHDNRRRR